jgi:hypothetical protein
LYRAVKENAVAYANWLVFLPKFFSFRIKINASWSWFSVALPFRVHQVSLQFSFSFEIRSALSAIAFFRIMSFVALHDSQLLHNIVFFQYPKGQLVPRTGLIA